MAVIGAGSPSSSMAINAIQGIFDSVQSINFKEKYISLIVVYVIRLNIICTEMSVLSLVNPIRTCLLLSGLDRR